MSEAVAYLTQLEVQQKALPSAAGRTGIIPIRVNLAWTRDFAHAAAESGSAGSVAFNEGCVLAHKLAALAARVERAFAPRPDECRPVSYFDSIILSHRNAMKQSAELMRMAASVFADSCNALESLAKVVQQSDSGTAPDAVRRHKIIMQDGTGVML